MNPTLYDILGVAPDASREEIRNAWRDAADRFEPGEGGSTKQFRLFNEAAEVLLDPERRKAYDAQLSGGKDSDRDKAEGKTEGQSDKPQGRTRVGLDKNPDEPEKKSSGCRSGEGTGAISLALAALALLGVAARRRRAAVPAIRSGSSRPPRRCPASGRGAPRACRSPGGCAPRS